MIVKGRDKPTVCVRLNNDGTVTFRIEFDMRPDAWAEIILTWDELQELVSEEIIPTLETP